MNKEQHASSSARTGAYTLVELLVVIAVIGTVSALVTPAFTRALASGERGGAVSTLLSTLNGARLAALQRGTYTGVVVLFDVEQERVRLLPVELASAQANLVDLSIFDTSSTNDVFDTASANDIRPVPAAAMRPLRGAEPVALPSGYGVYGLSYALDPAVDSLDNRPGVAAPTPTYAGWYWHEAPPRFDVNGESIYENPWLFPHNDPLLMLGRTIERPWERSGWSGGNSDDFRSNPGENVVDAVWHADSFFVGFTPEGTLLEPHKVVGTLPKDFYLEYEDLPIDLLPAARPEPLDAPLSFDPGRYRQSTFLQRHDYSNANPQLPEELHVGPNPEVHLRPAAILAIAPFSEMAAATGIAQPWFIRGGTVGGDSDADDAAPPVIDIRSPSVQGREPDFHDLESDAQDNVLRAMCAWIDGNATVIGFAQRTGEPKRRPRDEGS